MSVIRIDASGLVLGRMSTQVAKALRLGNEVIIVNAEKVIITGSPASVINEYKAKRNRGKVRRGPFFPKMPDRIVKRTVRGMLPHQITESKNALKRLMVYIGTPKEMAGEKFVSLPQARLKSAPQYITLEDLARELGYTPR